MSALSAFVTTAGIAVFAAAQAADYLTAKRNDIVPQIIESNDMFRLPNLRHDLGAMVRFKSAFVLGAAAAAVVFAFYGVWWFGIGLALLGIYPAYIAWTNHKLFVKWKGGAIPPETPFYYRGKWYVWQGMPEGWVEV